MTTMSLFWYLMILCRHQCESFEGGSALVIDAGSTGTRPYRIDYTFDGSTPVLSTTPGANCAPITDYNNFSSELTKVIEPLFSDGNAPKKVLLGATAGFRTLHESKREEVMSQQKEMLSTKYPDAKVVARGISGNEEGIYSFLAANYLANKLDGSENTFGILEVGGASMQISVPLKEGASVLTNRYEELFPEREIIVESGSVLGYGLNEAFDGFVKWAADDSCTNPEKKRRVSKEGEELPR